MSTATEVIDIDNKNTEEFDYSRRDFVFTTKSSSVDVTNRTFEAIITTPKEDRYGEIIDPLGAMFEDDPNLLFNHDPSIILGIKTVYPPQVSAEDIRMKFFVSNAKTVQDLYWIQIQEGVLRKLSIGFIPKVIERNAEGILVHRKYVIVEVSMVAIPANTDARILCYKSISTPEIKLNFKEMENTELLKEIEKSKKEVDALQLEVTSLKDAIQAKSVETKDSVEDKEETQEEKNMEEDECNCEEGDESCECSKEASAPETKTMDEETEEDEEKSTKEEKKYITKQKANEIMDRVMKSTISSVIFGKTIE